MSFVSNTLSEREGGLKSGPLRGHLVGLFFRLRAGRVLGLALFLAGLFRFRSYHSRPVFGLWSYPFFLFLLLISAVWLVELARSLRVLRLRDSSFHSDRSILAKLLDLAMLTWGAASFLDAGEAPLNAGRVTELVFFGSIVPAAAILEWIALLLLFVATAAFVAPRLKGKWARVGLAVGTVFALAVIGEGILRTKVAVAPQVQPFPTSSHMAWKRRYVRVNREGWRDVDHAIAREAGTRRLLVVGDSFGYGLGIVRIEDRLGEQLARKLSTATGERWESMNVSTGGANTLDEILFLNRAIAYRPDLVLLTYVFNDMDYLLPSAHVDVFESRGKFHPFLILFRNFYLFQELYMDSHIVYWRLTGADFGQEYENAQLLSRHLQDVARFVELAEQAGATARVVPFSIRIVQSPQWRRRYKMFVDRARAHGIPVCSLEKTFDGLTYGELNINAIDGHPNEKANLRAANAVAECLTAEPSR